MDIDTLTKSCGRSPARWFTVRRHVGMLFQQRFYKVEAWLCRPHARQFIGSWLVRTLIQGWWGAISFFVNFFVIAADLVQLTKALFMRKPAESN